MNIRKSTVMLKTLLSTVLPPVLLQDEAHQIRELRRQIDVNWIKTPTDGWGGGGRPGDFESIQGVECGTAKKKIIDELQLLCFIVTVLFSLR